jgi:hypothetical protein
VHFVLPVGTRIRLRVVRNKIILEALATVIYSEPRLGMGVSFTQLSPDQKSILENWLADVACPSPKSKMRLK